MPKDKPQVPYVTKTIRQTVQVYNPKYGDERMCECGHIYQDHFDLEAPAWYDGASNFYGNQIVCKNCYCIKFRLQTTQSQVRCCFCKERKLVSIRGTLTEYTRHYGEHPNEPVEIDSFNGALPTLPEEMETNQVSLRLGSGSELDFVVCLQCNRLQSKRPVLEPPSF